jgi:hypothetical protein
LVHLFPEEEEAEFARIRPLAARAWAAKSEAQALSGAFEMVAVLRQSSAAFLLQAFAGAGFVPRAFEAGFVPRATGAAGFVPGAFGAAFVPRAIGAVVFGPAAAAVLHAGMREYP